MCLNECTKHGGNVKIKWTTFHWKKKGKKEKKKKERNMKYTTFSNVICAPLIYTPKSNSHNKYVETEIEK